MANLKNLLQTPQRLPKSNASWSILLNYQSRSHSEQLTNGKYCACWVDIDGVEDWLTIETLSTFLNDILDNAETGYTPQPVIHQTNLVTA